ncbi:MAG: carbonate dehydratase [Planctomycetota bacterium]
MKYLPELFVSNREWSSSMTDADRDFFAELAKQQTPNYLWIGCADSRVPANQIVGLPPGSVFVHRNIANVVVHTDLNCLSVIEYAVNMLGVEHIIVCGHYGCGGVQAALADQPLGLIDNWLRHIRDVRQKYLEQLSLIDDPGKRLDALCELNVLEQVRNVCNTSIVQDAWRRGDRLVVHSWIYGLADGMLRDLGACIAGPEELSEAYRLQPKPAEAVDWPQVPL